MSYDWTHFASALSCFTAHTPFHIAARCEPQLPPPVRQRRVRYFPEMLSAIPREIGDRRITD